MKPKCHTPKPSSEDSASKLAKMWRATEMGDLWVDAHLPQLAKYLLGARGLRVPPEFEWIIPSNL